MKTLLNSKKAQLLAVCLTCLLAATGCNEVESTNNPFGYKTDCVRGVVYYTGASRMAPAYKKDGTLYTCDS